MCLKELIKNIRNDIQKGCVSSQKISEATESLRQLGFEYDLTIFPELRNTSQFTNNNSEIPESLAEALLWKIGKWKSYKKFRSQFDGSIRNPTNTDVVFYAFAKHLKDDKNPIYDQHTLRALWAIDGTLNDEDISKIKNNLLTQEKNWKKTMSGPHAIECYNIYCSRIEAIKGDASLKEIDMLLMPLGQAIKKLTNNYGEFKQLCE